MKKLLVAIAIFGLPFATLTGCGGGGTEVIAPAADSDKGITDSQAAEYEKQMKSGAYGSNTRPPAN